MKNILFAIFIFVLLPIESKADNMLNNKLSRPDLATSFGIFFDDLLTKAAAGKDLDYFKKVYPEADDVKENIEWLNYASQHKQPRPFPRMLCVQNSQSCIVKLPAEGSVLYQKFQLKNSQWVMVDLSDEEYKNAETNIK